MSPAIEGWSEARWYVICRKTAIETFFCGLERNWIYGTRTRYASSPESRPEAVIIAAAKVGGIQANSTFPVEFLLENLQIQNNLIATSFEFGVKKLLFLGSSCIYPKLATQPIREDSLLTGPLEPSNEPYALAKIAGIKLCQAYAREYGTDFISPMPTNIYGPGDNFDLDKSHVLPALIRKVHEAKVKNQREVTIWGTGTPRREFLHADDLADALRFLRKTMIRLKSSMLGTVRM